MIMLYTLCGKHSSDATDLKPSVVDHLRSGQAGREGSVPSGNHNTAGIYSADRCVFLAVKFSVCHDG